MDAGPTALPGPRFTAVGRGHNEAVSADGPAVRRTVGGESDRIEMVFRRRADLSPLFAPVFGQHDCATRPDRNRVLPILNVQSIQTRDYAGRLAFPLKAAVRGVKDHTVGAHRPTVELVTGETNRADGVALRARVLPLPAAVGCLGERR